MIRHGAVPILGECEAVSALLLREKLQVSNAKEVNSAAFVHIGRNLFELRQVFRVEMFFGEE